MVSYELKYDSLNLGQNRSKMTNDLNFKKPGEALIVWNLMGMGSHDYCVTRIPWIFFFLGGGCFSTLVPPPWLRHWVGSYEMLKNFNYSFTRRSKFKLSIYLGKLISLKIPFGSSNFVCDVSRESKYESLHLCRNRSKTPTAKIWGRLLEPRKTEIWKM